MPNKPYKSRKNYKKKTTKSQIKSVVDSVLSKRVEVKYHDYDYTLAGGSWSSGGSVVSLSDVAQGISDFQRVGDSLSPTKLDVRAVITLGSGGFGSTVRSIIFKWKAQSSIDTLVPDKVLQPGYPGTVFAPIAPYNHDNRGKFQILSDKTYQLYGGSSGNKYIKQTVYLKNHKIQFYGGTTTDQFNGIYHIIMCDNVLAGSPTIDVRSRMTYTDM